MARSKTYYGLDQLPAVLRLPEICAVLRCSEQTARKLLSEGRLRGVKVGREWRVEKGALVEFLNNAA